MRPSPRSLFITRVVWAPINRENRDGDREEDMLDEKKSIEVNLLADLFGFIDVDTSARPCVLCATAALRACMSAGVCDTSFNQGRPPILDGYYLV
jgi:hypothetical protein